MSKLYKTAKDYVIPPTPRQPDCPNRATIKQCRYAKGLGGEYDYCYSLSVGDAGEYIQWLKETQ